MQVTCRVPEDRTVGDMVKTVTPPGLDEESRSEDTFRQLTCALDNKRGEKYIGARLRKA